MPPLTGLLPKIKASSAKATPTSAREENKSIRDSVTFGRLVVLEQKYERSNSSVFQTKRSSIPSEIQGSLSARYASPQPRSGNNTRETADSPASLGTPRTSFLRRPVAKLPHKPRKRAGSGRALNESFRRVSTFAPRSPG